MNLLCHPRGGCNPGVSTPNPVAVPFSRIGHFCPFQAEATIEGVDDEVAKVLLES
jgi:hypothetical protein